MNIHERQVKAAEAAMKEHVDAFQAIYKRAKDDDGRTLTEDERLEVEEHVRAVEVLKVEKDSAEKDAKTVDQMHDLGRHIGPIKDIQVGLEPADRVAMSVQKSLGAAFIDSAGYKSVINQFRETGRFREGFSTGAVALDMKGTLLEGAGGGGGALAATVPQVIPGVVDKLFQSLTIADLILSGQASTNTIRYVVEGTATSGAAGVAEGGTKPESTVGLTTTDEPVKKIATLLPVSEEMLEDAPAIQSYINGRLALFVRIEEERQLLRGTSGGNEVQGILTSRSVPVYAGGTAAGSKAEQTFKAMNGMRGSAFLEPEWIVMNPSDWQDIRLAKDTANQYYGGGPFQGPYGSGTNFSGSGQLAPPTDQIWNKPVYVTGALGAGTALVGTSASAQVFRRGGLTVEASNSHSNYFQLNLVAIRAEERLALAVYRPTGFVEVRLA